VDVLAGAAGAWLVHRSAVIVKLQSNADDVIAFALQHGRNDGRIHAARHGGDDARFAGRLGETE